jgi:hypothetical protein
MVDAAAMGLATAALGGPVGLAVRLQRAGEHAAHDRD